MLFSGNPIRYDLPAEEPALDALLELLPGCPAVFLLDVGEGQQPYLARTGSLRRRALRLLKPKQQTSRMLNLRGIARELQYWPVQSNLAATLTLLEQAKSVGPGRYRKLLRLRMPYYVEVLTRNRFPRCVVTRSPKNPSAAYGPFLFRSHAEEFLNSTLDLFLMRRCDEELVPSPAHPGCIYGEMGMCLRPCQAATTDAEYRRETRELLGFLESNGAGMRETLERQRAEASERMDFEEAARLHKRLSKLEQSQAAHRGFARMLREFHGVAVTKGHEDGHAQLWPVWEGQVNAPVSLAAEGLNSAGITGPLLRGYEARTTQDNETQQELLAVLTKWTHSSWCDGEWIPVPDPLRLPGRKLVNAVRRICARRSDVAATDAETNHGTPPRGEAGNEPSDI